MHHLESPWIDWRLTKPGRTIKLIRIQVKVPELERRVKRYTWRNNKNINIYIHTHIYIHTYIYYLTGEGNGNPFQYSWPEISHGRRSLVGCNMGSLRVGHNWATSLARFTFMHWRRKWQPTPVFLPGESQGQRSLVGCCLWDCTELDTTEVTWQQQQQHTT